MTELIVELARDMQAHGFGVYGTTTPADRTIFASELPSDVNEGLYLVNAPSPPPHIYIDTEYPIIEVWAISPHTDRAEALLRNVFETYHRRYAYTLGAWYISFSQALGNFVDVDRSRNGSKLFRLSIQFISRNLNHVS